MGPSVAAADSFARALGELERCLDEGAWEAAGAAADALARACAACAEVEVKLPVEVLQQAEAAYSRCIERAICWGQDLQSEAQMAGASSRALHSYTRG